MNEIVSFVNFLEQEHDPVTLLASGRLGELEGVEGSYFGGGRLVLAFEFVDEVGEGQGGGFGGRCGLLHFGF